VLLVSGRLLARNTVLNLVGNVGPMAVALVAIPLLIRGVGTDRFGVLVIAWMVVGYFTLFDMGIGRATTKFVAERLALGAVEDLPQLIWTSIAMMAGFGTVGGLVFAGVTPLMVTRLLNIPPPLEAECLLSFYLLALSIPVVLTTIGIRGVLEAQQRFAVINAIRVPANSANYLLPLLALPFSDSLFAIVSLLVAGRLVVFLVYLYFCLGSLPGGGRPVRPDMGRVKELLGFGAWLTVSNVISPLMTYIDRFVIGAMLTMSAVAYYATPYEIVTKLWVIYASMMVVLFPAFSAYAAVNRDELPGLQDRAIMYMLLFYTPVVVVVIAMAEPFLGVWLGGEFAERSTLVMQILGVGVLVNAVGAVPYHVIQAMGRADLTAKCHMVELPLYLAMIWFFVSHMGINGVAIAWMLRLILDTSLWIWFSARLLPESGERLPSRMVPRFLASGLALSASVFLAGLSSLSLRIALLAGMLLVMTGVSLRYGLTSPERSFLRQVVLRMTGRKETCTSW